MLKYKITVSTPTNYLLSIIAKSPARSTVLVIITLMRILQVAGCVARSVRYFVHYARRIIFQVDSDHRLSDRECEKDDEIKEDVSGTEM
jgi:hypothetical protein